MSDRERISIPKHFSSLEETGEFWDTHDLGDYWDQTKEVEMSFRPKPRSLRVLPCPECGSLAMKRVWGPCPLQDGTVIPDLERFPCSRCRANFFGGAAIRTIAAFRKRSSRYKKLKEYRP